MTEQAQWNLEQLQQQQKQLHVAKPDWWKRWSKNNLRAFCEQGWPTRKHEQWKYTDTNTIQQQQLQIAEPTEAQIDISPYLLENTLTAVFVDGYFQPQLSQLDELPEEVILASLSDLSAEELYALRDCIESQNTTTPFVLLNAGLLQDGLLLYVPTDVVIEQPIHLLHIQTQQGESRMQHLRHTLILESNAQASLVEEYLAADDVMYFNNVVTDVVVQANADLQHYKLQREGSQAYHIAQISIAQQRDSRVETYQVQLGAKLARDDLQYELTEQGTYSQLTGFYYLQNKQHIDMHTMVDHFTDHCHSVQNYHGIVADQATAVFNGKVLVHPNADATIAKQNNRNLLLSPQAQVNTKPELEIYADDVQCAHGATVGELDADALFYLRSRGIAEQQAKQLLTQAFANEIFALMPNESIQKHFRKVVQQQMNSEIQENDDE